MQMKKGQGEILIHFAFFYNFAKQKNNGKCN